MKNDLVHVKPLVDHRLDVRLADGRQGVFDVRPWLDQPGLRALRDPAYFAQVGVLLGAATWPGGEDISPETLAAALRVEQPA